MTGSKVNSVVGLEHQPLGMEQYEHIRNMSEEIRAIAPDARVLTTYYCGKRPPS